MNEHEQRVIGTLDFPYLVGRVERQRQRVAGQRIDALAMLVRFVEIIHDLTRDPTAPCLSRPP